MIYGLVMVIGTPLSLVQRSPAHHEIGGELASNPLATLVGIFSGDTTWLRGFRQHDNNGLWNRLGLDLPQFIAPVNRAVPAG